MIAGFELFSGDTLRIDRRVIGGVGPNDCDIAIVFPDDALYPHMTAAENLAFGLKSRDQSLSSLEAKRR